MLIYKIINLINNDGYVGKLVNESMIDKYWGSGHLIKPAIKKYGKENFKKIILESGITDHNLLCEREIYLIKKENTKWPNGYNLVDGGEGAFGLIHSEETKDKIRKSLLGRKRPLEVRIKISAAHKGKKKSIDAINKMKIALKGRKLSAETIEKLKKYKGKKHSMFGAYRSDETKMKISAALKGKTAWNKGLSGEEYIKHFKSGVRNQYSYSGSTI